jgi:hypothetical protein
MASTWQLLLLSLEHKTIDTKTGARKEKIDATNVIAEATGLYYRNPLHEERRALMR